MINRTEVGRIIARKPHEMDILMKSFFNLTTGIKITQVTIK